MEDRIKSLFRVLDSVRFKFGFFYYDYIAIEYDI